MSDVVTATRQVLQDLVVPEMRELRARVDALEVRITEGFANIKEELRAAQKHTDVRFDEMRALFSESLQMAQMRERLARVEAQQQAAAPPQPAPTAQPQAQAHQ